MGVTGCGKTTVGRRLAERRRAAFVEGDELHPAENVRKMASGVPLDDADRRPWLEAIGRRIDDLAAEGRPVVVACSALRAAYRRLLAGRRADVRFVYLKATPELIRARLAARPGHFMPTALIDSQFAALEEPQASERILTVDASLDAEEIVKRVLRDLGPA